MPCFLSVSFIGGSFLSQPRSSRSRRFESPLNFQQRPGLPRRGFLVRYAHRSRLRTLSVLTTCEYRNCLTQQRVCAGWPRRCDGHPRLHTESSAAFARCEVATVPCVLIVGGRQLCRSAMSEPAGLTASDSFSVES